MTGNNSSRIPLWAWGASSVLILLIPVYYGPFSVVWNECLICGKSRVEKKYLGVTCYRRTTSTQTSEWVMNRVPKEHSHIWHGHAGESREGWFKNRVHGSGPGPLAWTLAHRQMFGDKIASEYVEIFHSLLKSKGKEEALVFHREHMLPLRLMYSTNHTSPPSRETLLNLIERSKVNFIAELYSRPDL